MRVITAEQAAQLVQPGDSILISGSGGGHAVPEAVLEAIERRYLAENAPGGLCLIHAVGIGDRASKGAARFAHPGMLRRSITGALIDSPALIDLALQDKIESYTLPQGVLSQIMRDMAAGRPGLVTRTGLHTFVDPRHGGARQSPSAREDLVELLEIDGREWLRFKPLPLDVVFLRGTTADEDGNIMMEQEAIPGEMLSCAQAGRCQGAAVVVQVKRMAKRGTLSPRLVKIPGILVDYVVVDPEQRQTYHTVYNPSYAGELRVPTEGLRRLPFDHRKIIARRAAMELVPGAICNLGAGISTGISSIAAEEDILDLIVLTNEQGFIGGAPLTGPDSGAALNYDAVVDQPYQFDFYDGGGLDLAFLSAAEVDPAGNVNISRFGSKIVGIGGFINISQNARKVVFSGTFSAGGLEIACEAGQLRVVSEGRHSKFVGAIEQVCYNAPFAEREGRSALFVTERCVFRAARGTLELIEVAPGIDVKRDILERMAFQPEISNALRPMDPRLFAPEPMGLRADLELLSRHARAPRRQAVPA
ncbi:MAG TPA: CoA-transferase [Acetobacteraceae bacterium]|jgi:propionate CoA-transferase|nr:CoA-transferase [Acetobacteraceae bacterium]